MAYDGSDAALLREIGVHGWNAWRRRNVGHWPDLVGADLRGMDLRGVNFFTADLRSADLSESNLEGATLQGSVLIRTNFTNANLRGANIYIANLNGAILNGADLTSATFGVTILVDLDLRNVRGLEKIKHMAPSHVGIDTIYRSHGEIPTSFLKNTGMPAGVIAHLEAMGEVTPQYQSCFISYSSVDNRFVQLLYDRLRAKDVRCWFAPEDMKIGEKIRPSLHDAINKHDKLLLVLSSASVMSQWVEQEVEKALERERSENRTVLFPVRIDDAVFSVDAGWASDVRRSRHIGDFTEWSNPGQLEKAFIHLMAALKKPDSGTSRPGGA